MFQPFLRTFNWLRGSFLKRYFKYKNNFWTFIWAYSPFKTTIAETFISKNSKIKVHYTESLSQIMKNKSKCLVSSKIQRHNTELNKYLLWEFLVTSVYYKVQKIFNSNASLYSFKGKSFLCFDLEEIEEVRLRRPLSVDWKQDNKLKLYFHR